MADRYRSEYRGTNSIRFIGPGVYGEIYGSRDWRRAPDLPSRIIQMLEEAYEAGREEGLKVDAARIRAQLDGIKERIDDALGEPAKEASADG